MRVLILAEDFVKDESVLQPIIEAMLNAVGRPRTRSRFAKIHVFTGRAKRSSGISFSRR